MRYSHKSAPNDPAEYPACYLSLEPRENLHPHGEPACVLDVLDPMLELTRSFVEHPYLVAGRLYWNDDNEGLGALTIKHFRQVSSWIRRHWRRRPEDGYYLGPEADALLSSGALEASYFPPRVTIRQGLKGTRG